MSEYRTPTAPSDPEAERAVLGCVLMRPSLLTKVMAIIGTEPNPFYETEHQKIYETLQLFQELNIPFDRVTANRELDQSYMAECVASVPTSANFAHYASIVAETHYKRRAIDTLNAESRAILSGQPITDSISRVKELVDNPPKTRRLELDDLTDWQNPPAPKYVIQDMCEESITTVLTSPGGMGKSLFAVGLGISVATGYTVFDSFKPTSPGHVLYISGEDPTNKVKQRMAGYARQHLDLPKDLVDSRFHVKSRNNRPLIQGDRNTGVKLTPYYYDLQSYCLEHEPRLIILDTLRRCIGGIPGGENDNGVIGFLIEQITNLVRPYGGMALVLSHSRKPSGDAQNAVTRDDARGASALVDEARAHFMLTMDPEGTDALITLTKANYAPRGMLYTTWRFSFGCHDGCPYMVETGQSSYSGGDLKALIPSIVDYIQSSQYDNWPQKLAQDGYCKAFRDSLQRKFPWAGQRHITDACVLATEQGYLYFDKGRRGAGRGRTDVLRVPEAGQLPPPRQELIPVPQGELYDDPYEEEEDGVPF